MNCSIKRFVKRIYPSGSWFAPQGGSPLAPTGKLTRISQRDVAIAGGKPSPLSAKLRPADGYVNCSVKQLFSSPRV